MPSLLAIIGADSRPMARELKAVERMAAQSGVNITRNIQGSSGHGSSGAIRETMVLLREMGRGNWSRVPGSLSILINQLGLLKLIVRDNAGQAKILADALAQKAAKSMLAARAAKEQAEASAAGFAAMRTASAGTILAVQADKDKAASALAAAEADRAKAIAARQAATAMEAEGIAARFSIGPLGWVALGLTAIATAAYFLVQHYRKLEAEQKNLSDLMDTTTRKFSDQAAAMKHAGEEAADYLDWLRKISDAEGEVGDATEETLKSMRERAKYQRELAESQGASKSQLAEMEIAEAKKELEIVNAAKAEAQRQVMKDKVAAGNAELSANNPGRAERIKRLGEKGEFAARVADAAQAAMKAGSVNTGQIDPVATRQAAAAGGAGPVYAYRPANENDKMNFTVDGKEFNLSVAEAKKIFDDITSEENKLAATQKQLNDLLAEKKRLTEKDIERVKKLTQESNELTSDLANKKEFLPQLTTSGVAKFFHGSVNSLQQVGAYAAPAGQAIQTNILHHVAAINAKLTKHHEENQNKKYMPKMGGVQW